MRDKVIDVAFSYTKSIASRVLYVSSHRRVASSSRNEYDFTVKEFEYVFNADASVMNNHADVHVFGRKFRVYFMKSKRCTVSPFLIKYSK